VTQRGAPCVSWAFHGGLRAYRANILMPISPIDCTSRQLFLPPAINNGLEESDKGHLVITRIDSGSAERDR
jgi:hypothetical protein